MEPGSTKDELCDDEAMAAEFERRERATLAGEMKALGLAFEDLGRALVAAVPVKLRTLVCKTIQKR